VVQRHGIGATTLAVRHACGRAGTQQCLLSTCLERGVLHGGAAILDDHSLPTEALKVRQRLGQDGNSVQVRELLPQLQGTGGQGLPCAQPACPLSRATGATWYGWWGRWREWGSPGAGMPRSFGQRDRDALHAPQSPPPSLWPGHAQRGCAPLLHGAPRTGTAPRAQRPAWRPRGMMPAAAVQLAWRWVVRKRCGELCRPAAL
jgi:hypothetical protein